MARWHRITPKTKGLEAPENATYKIVLRDCCDKIAAVLAEREDLVDIDLSEDEARKGLQAINAHRDRFLHRLQRMVPGDYIEFPRPWHFDQPEIRNLQRFLSQLRTDKLLVLHYGPKKMLVECTQGLCEFQSLDPRAVMDVPVGTFFTVSCRGAWRNLYVLVEVSPVRACLVCQHDTTPLQLYQHTEIYPQTLGLVCEYQEHAGWGIKEAFLELCRSLPAGESIEMLLPPSLMRSLEDLKTKDELRGIRLKVPKGTMSLRITKQVGGRR